MSTVTAGRLQLLVRGANGASHTINHRVSLVVNCSFAVMSACFEGAENVQGGAYG